MGLDTVLKRYFAGVILALIALAAYFQASGITQLVGSSLAPDEKSVAAAASTTPRAPMAASSAAPEEHATSARWILERNPFDSVTPRPLDAPPSSPDAGASAVVDLEHYENAPPC